MMSSPADMERMKQMIAKRMSPQEYAVSFFEALPAEKQNAVKGLQGVQQDIDQVLQEQCQAVEDVMRAFRDKLAPFYARRAEILAGAAPSDAEVGKAFADTREAPAAPPTPEGAGSDDLAKTRKESAEKAASQFAEGKGFPGFWLEAMRNHEVFEEMISEQDAAILKHLVDVDYIFLQPPRLGFALRFVFEANDAIASVEVGRKGPIEHKKESGPCPAAASAVTRLLEAGAATEAELTAGLRVPEGGAVLVKTYYLEADCDGDPVSMAIDGSAIKWKQGKNPGVVMRTKKQTRGKGKNKQTRTVEFEDKVPTFFDFFDAPTPEDDGDEDDHGESRFDRDFEIARLLRGSIIPRAVEWFLGRAPMPDSFDNDDEEDGEGFGGDEEDGEEGGAQQHEKPGGKPGGEKECKQQ